jgi:hypothetical protein
VPRPRKAHSFLHPEKKNPSKKEKSTPETLKPEFYHTPPEKQAPLLPGPGRKARCDYEYKRNGVANIFVIFEPLKNKKQLQVDTAMN